MHAFSITMDQLVRDCEMCIEYCCENAKVIEEVCMPVTSIYGKKYLVIAQTSTRHCTWFCFEYYGFVVMPTSWFRCYGRLIVV